MDGASISDMEAAEIILCNSVDLPCAYCRRPMVGSVIRNGPTSTAPTRDHIWPKEFRSIDAGRCGTVWCCHRCNLVKGDMMPAEWVLFMRDNPEWWIYAKPYNRKKKLNTNSKKPSD